MNDDSSSGNREIVTDQDLLAALRQANSPVITTSEITDMDEISITQGQVLKRLKSLEKKGQISSKSYSAKPQVRLWWHEDIEIKRAWPSDDETTEEIGVEVVDALDLPGRNEIVRKRREAVNAVFKMLFDKETASKRELSLVGWGADMDTYADPDSLWNNCIKKALDQSPFYILNESEKNWLLSTLGSKIKQIDNQALWEDWNKHKKELDRLYHGLFYGAFYNESPQFRPNQHHSCLGFQYEGIEHILRHELLMDGPAWSHSTGTFSLIAELIDDPENLKIILDNITHLTSDLETDFRLENQIETNSFLEIRCAYQIDIEASRILQRLNNENKNRIRSLTTLSDWISETDEQLLKTIIKAERLIHQA